MSGQQTEQPDAREHWIEKLADGSPVLIRPLREEDQEEHRRFLSTIACASRRLRFITGLSGGVPGLDTPSTPSDGHQRMAYVALVHADGKLQQIGVGRYAPIPGSQHCECALAVKQDWQRKGLGRRLLQHLIEAARRNGYECMISRDLANNFAMHRLAKAQGFTSRYPGGDVSEILHELDLRT